LIHVVLKKIKVLVLLSLIRIRKYFFPSIKIFIIIAIGIYPIAFDLDWMQPVFYYIKILTFITYYSVYFLGIYFYLTYKASARMRIEAFPKTKQSVLVKVFNFLISKKMSLKPFLYFKKLIIERDENLKNKISFLSQKLPLRLNSDIWENKIQGIDTRTVYIGSVLLLNKVTETVSFNSAFINPIFSKYINRHNLASFNQGNNPLLAISDLSDGYLYSLGCVRDTIMEINKSKNLNEEFILIGFVCEFELTTIINNDLLDFTYEKIPSFINSLNNFKLKYQNDYFSYINNDQILFLSNLDNDDFNGLVNKKNEIKYLSNPVQDVGVLKLFTSATYNEASKHRYANVGAFRLEQYVLKSLDLAILENNPINLASLVAALSETTMEYISKDIVKKWFQLLKKLSKLDFSIDYNAHTLRYLFDGMPRLLTANILKDDQFLLDVIETIGPQRINYDSQMNSILFLNNRSDFILRYSEIKNKEYLISETNLKKTNYGSFLVYYEYLLLEWKCKCAEQISADSFSDILKPLSYYSLFTRETDVALLNIIVEKNLYELFSLLKESNPLLILNLPFAEIISIIDNDRKLLPRGKDLKKLISELDVLQKMNAAYAQECSI
jgi:hypothetical protein